MTCWDYLTLSISILKNLLLADIEISIHDANTAEWFPFCGIHNWWSMNMTLWCLHNDVRNCKFNLNNEWKTTNPPTPYIVYHKYWWSFNKKVLYFWIFSFLFLYIPHENNKKLAFPNWLFPIKNTLRFTDTCLIIL